MTLCYKYSVFLPILLNELVFFLNWGLISTSHGIQDINIALRDIHNEIKTSFTGMPCFVVLTYA